MYGLNFGYPAIPDSVLRRFGHRGTGPHRIRLSACGCGRFRATRDPLRQTCPGCHEPMARGDLAVLVGVTHSETARDRMIVVARGPHRRVHVITVHCAGGTTLYGLYVS